MNHPPEYLIDVEGTLRDLSESHSDPAVVFRDQRVILVNPECQQLFGAAHSEQLLRSLPLNLSLQTPTGPSSLSFTHISVCLAEDEPGGGEVEHSTEASPVGLGSGGGFRRAVIVAAQMGDQFHEFIQRGWYSWWHGLVDNTPRWLPFVVREDGGAGQTLWDGPGL